VKRKRYSLPEVLNYGGTLYRIIKTVPTKCQKQKNCECGEAKHIVTCEIGQNAIFV
jgi:hypothetical protein